LLYFSRVWRDFLLVSIINTTSDREETLEIPWEKAMRVIARSHVSTCLFGEDSDGSI
jgi:hypothetical protein